MFPHTSVFYLARRLSVFAGGLNDGDAGYAKKTESDIDFEYDYVVNHIHEMNAEIEAETKKLQQLQEDYEKIKGQTICVRVGMMKLMVEAATADCLKDTDSNNPNNLFSRMKLLFAKNKT